MLKTVFAVACLAIVAYIVIDFIGSYRVATGTTWERILAAGKGSATLLWARFTALIGAVTSGMVGLADWLNAPGLADAIKAAMQPQYVAIFMVVVAVITEAARRRSL